MSCNCKFIFTPADPGSYINDDDDLESIESLIEAVNRVERIEANRSISRKDRKRIDSLLNKKINSTKGEMLWV